jgi:phage shock protein PspC (stress-responsive transcriptional regulator)
MRGYVVVRGCSGGLVVHLGPKCWTAVWLAELLLTTVGAVRVHDGVDIYIVVSFVMPQRNGSLVGVPAKGRLSLDNFFHPGSYL